ncbi:MAG: 3-phosphoshikimate 1-carboxyvinyltransferase [Acidobacteriota bacterium]
MAEAPARLPGPSGVLAGRLPVPPSKSLTNRALIAAAVAGGGVIVDPLDCEDTRLLATALETAGWAVEWRGPVITVGSMTPGESLVRVDLGNSGTGARLLLALLASVPGHFIVDGSSRLRERPMEPLIKALRALGSRVEASGNWRLPVSVEGRVLPGGQVDIRPGVSSQFVTALLLAAPLFQEGLALRVVGPLPSEPYLDLTFRVLGEFGGQVERSSDNREWRVAGGGLKRIRWNVEGDWSAAAFPVAAAAVAGGWVAVPGLDRDSAQGDRIICDILADAGMTFEWFGDRLVAKGPVTKPIFADLGARPDAFPALAAVAACRVPGSRLSGLGNLLHKESSRLEVMASNLRSLGARVVVGDETFEVEKTIDREENSLRFVRAADDHRVAMAMAVTALDAGPLELDAPSCVAKSFPEFWDRWSDLLLGSERSD